MTQAIERLTELIASTSKELNLPDEHIEAFDDFLIPEAERKDFKEDVADMFDSLLVHAPVDSVERFMDALSAYSGASRRAQTYGNVPIRDAACYATEMCLAVQYAESKPLLKEAVTAVFRLRGH